jgi:endonuclease III
MPSKKKEELDRNKLDHDQIEAIRRELSTHYPDVKTSLNYSNPYQLFVATVLSAQTTDQQVNKITADFFKVFPTVYDLVNLEPHELEPYLKRCGLYRHKSRYLIDASRMIVEQHSGKVPDRFEQLLKLPGVGRKTANVILSSAFGQPALAVDTHVFRVSRRLGLSSEKDVAKVEEQLKEIIPVDEWTAIHHRLIWHGRSTCHARKPNCRSCFLELLCLFALERRDSQWPGMNYPLKS